MILPCTAFSQVKDNVLTTGWVQQTCLKKEKLAGGEWIVTCDGVDQRTVTPAHAKEIESAEIDAKENPLLKSQIAAQTEQLSLKDQIIAEKDRQITNFGSIDLIRQAQIQDRNQIIGLFQALSAKQDKVEQDLAGMASSTKKRFIDKLPFRLVWDVALPAAVDIWTFKHPPYNPPAGSVVMTPCK